MTAGHVLIEIIRNTPIWEPVIIHTEDPFKLKEEVLEETGIKINAKNVPDSFETKERWIWQRQNKRKFLLSIHAHEAFSL